MKAKQEPVVKKVDPFEVGKHQPLGLPGPQVFSCAEKWPKKAGWYLANWETPAKRPEMEGIYIVRYMDPLLGCSDPIYPNDHGDTDMFKHWKLEVSEGEAHPVSACNGTAFECMYWTDAPLPDQVLETLKFLS